MCPTLYGICLLRQKGEKWWAAIHRREADTLEAQME